MDRREPDGAHDHMSSYWSEPSEMTLQSMLAPDFQTTRRLEYFQWTQSFPDPMLGHPGKEQLGSHFQPGFGVGLT